MMRYIHKITSLIRGVICLKLNKKVEARGWTMYLAEYVKVEIDTKAKAVFRGRINVSRFSRLCVREQGLLEVGEGLYCNEGCQIICRSHIRIGNNVQLGQNVLIYDHDHEFRCADGITSGLFNYEDVVIGDNVWIGANTVILRGTQIGDNCVIGAGSVIKGVYESNQLIVQKRTEKSYDIKRKVNKQCL